MKKSYRVKSQKDFQRVFQTKKSVANRQFVVYQIHKDEQPHYRVGISVGKKIGNAVVRNRLKRKIRAAIQSLDDQLVPEVDFIVIARSGTDRIDYQTLRKNLIHVLKLAHLFKAIDDVALGEENFD